MILRAQTVIAALALLALVGCANAFKDPVVLAAEDGNWDEAWEYVLPLAEAGVADAQVRVATMYARGMGRPVDVVEGLKFAILAQRGRGLLAERIAPAISYDATPEEQAEALARADAFETTPLPKEWRDRWRPEQLD